MLCLLLSRSVDALQATTGDWTKFNSYKPLCEIDQMLVDTLQERQEMFCITDPGMYDNPIVYVSDDFIDMTGYK